MPGDASTATEVWRVPDTFNCASTAKLLTPHAAEDLATMAEPRYSGLPLAWLCCCPSEHEVLTNYGSGSLPGVAAPCGLLLN
eukprot:355645-Chlamydomonas_euryale.AAC.35